MRLREGAPVDSFNGGLVSYPAGAVSADVRILGKEGNEWLRLVIRLLRMNDTSVRALTWLAVYPHDHKVRSADLTPPFGALNLVL